MRHLADIELTLAKASPSCLYDDTGICTWNCPKILTRLQQRHVSTSAAYSLLVVTVVLGLLGMPLQALAMIQQGDRGKEVVALQQRLHSLGYLKTNVTGYFGLKTSHAVIQFQQAKGLTPDSVVGKNTQAALNQQSSSSFLKASASNRLWQLGDRGDQVNVIQQRLAVAGFSSGNKGVFDEATEYAVRRFQQAKKLKVDGIVGKQTTAALPAISGTPSKTQKKATSWYEDKSVPLIPFIK